MNRDETQRLLRTRSALTSQPYGDETIDAWRQGLEGWDYEQCSRALTIAARHEKRITLAHVIAELPRQPTNDGPGGGPVEQWAGPTDTGRHAITMLRAHTRGQHHRLPAYDCPACTPATSTALQEEDQLW